MLNKLKSPLSNKEGSVLSIFKYSALAVVGVLMVTWLIIMVTHIRVESYVHITIYNLGDAVCESTTVTSDIQKEFKRRFDSYKWYTGDYEIIYYKTSYATGSGVRTKLGTSVNGNTINSINYNKGDVVEIVFRTTGKVLLDKMVISGSDAGLVVSYGGKIF